MTWEASPFQTQRKDDDLKQSPSKVGKFKAKMGKHGDKWELKLDDLTKALELDTDLKIYY